MRFEGEFRVPGQPLAVLERFAEVERMVKCMPGASIDGRDDDGNYLGGMLVAFGPKKIKFKGKVTASVDFDSLTGKLHVRGAADMRAGARAEVNVVYTVRDDASASKPTSIVALTSDAELGGVLADFGSTGGIAVTQALMDVFAQRCAEEFSKEASAPTSEGGPQPSTAATASESAVSANTADQGSAATAVSSSAPEQANEALSANALLWSIIRTKFKQFKKWLGLRS
jgi:carbon monoxide dehydrogenase subunit G